MCNATRQTWKKNSRSPCHVTLLCVHEFSRFTCSRHMPSHMFMSCHVFTHYVCSRSFSSQRGALLVSRFDPINNGCVVWLHSLLLLSSALECRDGHDDRGCGCLWRPRVHVGRKTDTNDTILNKSRMIFSHALDFGKSEADSHLDKPVMTDS